MPWSHPAARMREMILATRAILDCWYHKKPLDFRGEFYQHTLMTPFFTPTNSLEYGPPKVFLAAVGPLMTEVAGERDASSAPAHSEAYVPVTLPALARGLKSGPHAPLRAGDIMTAAPTRDRVTRRPRSRSPSTEPRVRVVLDAHGWGPLQPELNERSKRGQWKEMGEVISDDVLRAFAVESENAKGVAQGIVGRFGDLIDRTTWAYYQPGPERERELIGAFKELGAKAKTA
jgi:probable F420-dependent oxidoreductase